LPLKILREGWEEKKKKGGKGGKSHEGIASRVPWGGYKGKRHNLVLGKGYRRKGSEKKDDIDIREAIATIARNHFREFLPKTDKQKGIRNKKKRGGLF